MPSAGLDAELLLRHCLGWDRARLLVENRTRLEPSDLERFEFLVERRATRVPLQYLTKRQEFYGRSFTVSPAVLIPRPETEILVETVLRHLAATAQPLVVDIGTGSGCIALTIAAQRADARILATDVSPEALVVARENASELGLGDQVAFCQADLLPAETGLVDAVVSNPPYVDAAQRSHLMPEVRDHEPALALFPPGEALFMYRRLGPLAAQRLRPGGFVAVEVGHDQAEQVLGIFETCGLAKIEIVPDLQSIPRVVVVRRPAQSEGSAAPLPQRGESAVD